MPHLSMTENLWAILGGVFTGSLITLIGGGGSALAVPILTTLVGLTRIRVAMGTTAVSVATTALLSAYLHARRGAVLWSAALSFTLPGILGIVLGSRLQNDFSSHVLLVLLGMVMLLNASLILKIGDHQRMWPPLARLPVALRYAPPGLTVGVLAGMFGMGGGFLALPSMVLGGLSLSTAIGSSVVSVGSLGAASAVAYTLRGLVDWHVVIEYAAGGLFGAVLAMPLARRLTRQKRLLSLFMVVMLTGISIFLIANNVGSLYTHHRVL